jgi:L-asparaginase
VTHGTDTMEESAYLVDLLHEGDKPVVFTGAQRHAGSDDFDGPANLFRSVKLASSPEAAGIGTVLCMGGVAVDARSGIKVHTTDLRAFESRTSPPVVRFTQDSIEFGTRDNRPPPLQGVDLSKRPPRVDLITLSLGSDGDTIRRSLEAGAEGLVVAAFGMGNAPESVVAEMIRAAASGIPVIVATRCHRGPVAPVYGGGGHELDSGGAIFAGDLAPSKARVLLLAALAASDVEADLEDRISPHLVPTAQPKSVTVTNSEHEREN